MLSDLLKQLSSNSVSWLQSGHHVVNFFHLVSFLQSSVLLLSHMSARHAWSLHRTGAIPLPPRWPALPQPGPAGNLGPKASGQPPGSGLLPWVAWRQLIPGKRQGTSVYLEHQEETSVTWLPPRFESATSSRAIFGGQIIPPPAALSQMLLPM